MEKLEPNLTQQQIAAAEHHRVVPRQINDTNPDNIAALQFFEVPRLQCPLWVKSGPFCMLARGCQKSPLIAISVPRCRTCREPTVRQSLAAISRIIQVTNLTTIIMIVISNITIDG